MHYTVWKMFSLAYNFINSHTLFSWCPEVLQCDYYNWGHLDKVDQLDYRKVTIHSEMSVRQICLLGGICKVSNRKTLSGETFCLIEKCLLSMFKFCASNNLLFYYKLLIGPQPTMYFCFPVIWLINLSKWPQLQ